MLSKTPRFGVPHKSPYSDFVGPSTYDYATDKPLFQHKAPFLKSAKQEPSFFNPNYCKSLIYGVKDDMKDRRMGTSPSNRAPRKMHTPTEGAPPTNYTVKEPACPGAFDNKEKKKLKKFYVCRVPFTIVGSGPSVPTNLQKHGYYFDEEDKIVPVPQENIDRTGGPARYGPNMKKTMYDQNYKGIKIPKGPRGDCYGIDPNAPGPTHYNTGDLDFHRDPKGDEIRQMARLMTYLPRFLEKQEMNLIKDGFPGPGYYDIAKPICKACPPIGPTPLVTGAKRFKDDDPLSPGPADYDIEPVKYSISKLNVPFFNAARRFTPDNPVCSAAPGDYEIPSPIMEKLSKSMYYAPGQPPFGKGAKRPMLEVPAGPGPGDYTLYPEDENKINQPTSVFNSKSKRWPHQSVIRWDFLDVESAYKFLAIKKPTSIGKIPFNVASKRKGFYDYIPTPPLTKYCGPTSLPSKGYVLPQAKRFPDPKDNFPGPGTYLIHPLYERSMYGAYKTYNLKLKEEAVKMAFRCHPKDTWNIWAKERKRKKQLRWFLKDGKDYVHCHKDMKPYKT